MATNRQQNRVNEPKFQLRNKSSNTPQSIYLVFRFLSDKLVYPTGHKVHPRHWNSKTERVRNVTEVTDKDIINSDLDNLETNVKAFYKELLRQGKPINREILREKLDYPNGEQPAKDVQVSSTFFQFIEKFIEQSRYRTNPKTGKRLSPPVINKYENTLRRLKEFKRKTGKRIDFDTIDMNFYYEFMSFLTNDQNYATNTIGRYVKTVKEFLNTATDEGFNKNFKYKSTRFKTVSEDSDSIYLNENELSQLQNFDLSNNPRLERIRDLFLIGAWTGLRYSDYSRISKENINGHFIKIKQQKTDDVVVIPLHPIVKNILKKYHDHLPKVPTNQRTNVYLKELGKLVGLDQTVSKSITKGGVRHTEILKKYELISTHTARRSFATNLYKSGFPTISIMKITGHKTEAAFLKYIKVTPKEHAQLLLDHWNDKFSQA